MAVLLPNPISTALDADANVKSGATRTFYLSGTTTPVDVYQDADEDTPHAQPIQALSNGRWPAIYAPSDVLLKMVQDNGGGDSITVDPVNSLFSTGDLTITQSGPGAVARSLTEKLQYLAVSPMDYGAAGDGVTDDTDAVQKASNAAAAAGIKLIGEGRTYAVANVAPASGSVWEGINLITLPSDEDFTACVLLDGTSDELTDITFNKVTIDGNRANQTGISSLTEDGGRVGFRCVGRMSKITFRDCDVSYCAGSGFEFFSSTARDDTDDTDHCFSQILLENCTSTWNRQHGGYCDSIDGLTVRHCRFNDNGKDLNTDDAYTVGTRGARSPANIGGTLYGMGWDIEGYGKGSGFTNIRFEDCDLTGNQGVSMTVQESSIAPNASGFVSRKNFWFTRCKFDNPTGTSSNRPLWFYAGGYSTDYTPMFENINLVDCTTTGLGSPTFDSCKGVFARGGYWDVGSYSYRSTCTLCTVVGILAPSNKVSVFDSRDQSANARKPTTSATGGTLSSEVLAIRGYTPEGWALWRYTGTNTATATGLSTLSITLPTGQSPVNLSGAYYLNNGTGAAVAAALNPAQGAANVLGITASVTDTVPYVISQDFTAREAG